MSSLQHGGQPASRRAAIILIVGLAVVAMAFLASKALSHHDVRTPNPVAPLVGAVDKAKATAGAANRFNDQLNRQTGSNAPGSPAAGDPNSLAP